MVDDVSGGDIGGDSDASGNRRPSFVLDVDDGETSDEASDESSDDDDDVDEAGTSSLDRFLRSINALIRTHVERFGGVIYYHFRVNGTVNTNDIINMMRRVLRHETLPLRFFIMWAGVLSETDHNGRDKYRFFHSSRNTELLDDTFIDANSFQILREKLDDMDIVEMLNNERPDSKVKFVMLTNIVIKVFRRSYE